VFKLNFDLNEQPACEFVKRFTHFHAICSMFCWVHHWKRSIYWTINIFTGFS